jgi:DNA-binding Lrp family transcriptional regulator
MADPLSILFGSTARVKLLRFFLFNPSREFTFDDISRRARLPRRTARTELNSLEKAGVIVKRNMYIAIDGKTKKMKVLGYTLNKDFEELQALQTFLFETAPIDGKNLIAHLRKAGTIDFVAIAGVFVRDFEQSLDVLIAMKKISQSKIETAIRALESEIGMEIRFALMASDDLRYRVGMNDKLTRDLFDYKHQIIVDRIGIRNELASGSYRG